MFIRHSSLARTRRRLAQLFTGGSTVQCGGGGAPLHKAGPHPFECEDSALLAGLSRTALLLSESQGRLRLHAGHAVLVRNRTSDELKPVSVRDAEGSQNLRQQIVSGYVPDGGIVQGTIELLEGQLVRKAGRECAAELLEEQLVRPTRLGSKELGQVDLVEGKCLEGGCGNPEGSGETGLFYADCRNKKHKRRRVSRSQTKRKNK